jgi:signal transduction histidine kinase/CheY-like chemotaxis protein
VDKGVAGAIGERLPAPFEGVRYGDMFTADNYPEQDYYKLSVAARKKIWLEPYDWSGITMTSFYTPCWDEKEGLLGVVVADVDVTALAAPLREPVTRGIGYFAILSDKGNLLAYPPDPEKARVRANVDAIPSLLSVWPRMQSEREGILEDRDNLWAYERIANTNWLMLATLPRAAVTWPVLRIALGAALGAGLLLAMAVALFVRQLNQRLQPILQACEALVQTDTRRSIALKRSPSLAAINAGSATDAAGSDEIGVLGRSFGEMSRQIKDSFAALEQANEALEGRVEERTAFLQQLNEELVASQEKLESAREAAESSNRAKSEFLANMSHELRTPLNGILGYAQILQRKKTLSGPELHGVTVIQQCGNHLLLLINDILDLAKIEARKMEVAPEDLRFRSFLDGVVEICRVRAEQKNISFLYEPSPDLPPAVRADGKRLRQILLNLLGNAVKFTDVGGVTFTVSALAPGKIRFRVDDTGPGLDATQIAKIFAPFEQVDEAGKEREGTGLGLAIGQKIAALMGSVIQVESAPGKGASFWLDVDLPESTLAASPFEATSALDIEGFEGPRRTLLVVDDNAINRSLLVDTLEPLGFTVIEASDGQSALDRVSERRPDLVITDLAMPGMDGLELVRRLRLAPELAGMAIIVASASVFAADQHRSVEAGASDFLAKPVEIGDLLRQLQRHLALTWVHRKGEGAAGPGRPAGPVEAPSTVALDRLADLAPPDEALDLLLDLAGRGRVNAVIEQARRLEQADPALAPFVKVVNRLARGFQLKELASLLTRYRERSNVSASPDRSSA